ncbi:GNAT family N-acetyltransferase [Roseivirga sp.]|uniref:GNAT family N-acetyltransferase n=1 Tax=Roseivirga sp. TaxID=1964215 RepID=UPI003B520ADC
MPIEIQEHAFGEYLLSTDINKLDIRAIHQFLARCDWSKGIPLETVKASIEHSLNVGLYHKGDQIGFARVITDYSTIAYLGDVYILEDYQGQKLSTQLMDFIMKHPYLQGLRRWILLTSTADWLYAKFGFNKPARPELYMEKYTPDIYQKDIPAD